jgi:hypothetical protein
MDRLIGRRLREGCGVPQGLGGRYSRPMPRVAQADLFAPSPAPTADEPPPLEELRAILARVRAADRLPFADAAAAMAEELRVVGLSRRAGPEGAALASAILDEMERLHALTDR